MSKGGKGLPRLIWAKKEFSPPYVLRILRQFGFSDEEIEGLLK
jgi:hypothetical protein